MRCEVLAIGTELLLGQVADTSSAWIGEQLALAGVDCHYQVRVGDNRERIVAAIRQALARSEAVICCGGLGPTPDDLTREAIASVMGVSLELDEEIAARIEAMFAERGRRMSANNLRQAELPKGADAIPQRLGTAPGLVCRLGEKVIYAVPGVPDEMREMVTRAVVPDLAARAGSPAVIRSRTLRTWGVAESALAELLAPRVAALDRLGNPTIAFLASGIEGIKVRVTARGTGDDPEVAARALLDAEEAELRELLGPLVFGLDEQTMESAVGRLLERRGLHLALAESLTGGLIGSRVTAVAGASGWFLGSIVSYCSEAKRRLLGVGDGPVVSRVAAEQMADGAARLLGAEVGLSATGVAGPAEQEGQPVGTVWVGLSLSGEPAAARLSLSGGRERIRQIAAISALDVLRRRLLDLGGP